MRCSLDEPINIPSGSICIEYITINKAPEINRDGSQNQSIIECIQWLEPIMVGILSPVDVLEAPAIAKKYAKVLQEVV